MELKQKCRVTSGMRREQGHCTAPAPEWASGRASSGPETCTATGPERGLVSSNTTVWIEK